MIYIVALLTEEKVTWDIKVQNCAVFLGINLYTQTIRTRLEKNTPKVLILFAFLWLRLYYGAICEAYIQSEVADKY